MWRFALMAALFAGVMALLTPLGSIFQMDVHDEGYNLMKALLLERGFPLYSKIWSDQPPLFTYMLAAWQSLWGPSVAAMRSLELIWAGVLVAATAGIARREGGIPAGWLAALALVLSYHFLRLSVSILVGLPAIALAVTALYLLLSGKRIGFPRCLISGGLFGLALHVKLFIGPLALLPAAYLAREVLAKRLTAPAAARRLGCWLFAAGVIFGVVWLALYPGDGSGLGQLFRPHVAARSQGGFNPVESFLQLGGMLRHDLVQVLVVGLAALWLLARRNRAGLALLLPYWLWFWLFFIALYLHKPVWHHHYLLLAVPLALNTALSLRAVGLLPGTWRGLTSLGTGGTWRVAGAAIVLVALLAGAPGKITDYTAKLASSRETPTDRFVMQVLDWLGPVTRPDIRPDAKGGRKTGKVRWMVTDRQMYAYRASISVPPELAVTSWKRRVAGELGWDATEQAIHRYHPEVVLLSDESADDRFRQAVLLPDYRCYTHLPGMHFCIRSDLADALPRG